MIFTERMKWIFPITTALVLCIAIFNSFSLPNTYISSQYLLGYDYGFIKRGLLGEIYGLIFQSERYSYSGIVKFAIGLSLVFTAILIIATLRLEKSSRWILVPYLASPGFGIVFESTGYQEYINYIILFIYTTLSANAKTIHTLRLTLLISGIITLLIHEASFVLCIPLMMFVFLFRSMMLQQLNVKLRHILLSIAFTGFCFFAVSILISAASVVDIIQLNSMHKDVSAKSNFSPFKYVWMIMSYTIEDNLFLGLLEFKKPGKAMIMFWTAAVASPFVIFNILILRRSLWGLRDKLGASSIKILFYFSIAAILAPLGMHLIGTDYWRWSNLVAINSFIVLVFVMTYSPVCLDNFKAKLLIVLLVLFGFALPYRGLTPARWQLSQADIDGISAFLKGGFQEIDGPVNPSDLCRKKLPDGRWCIEESELDPRIRELRTAIYWEQKIPKR